jgi:hypothetical protein
LIVQNLITGNHASSGGGVYWAISSGVRGPILVNSTIADNDATNGSGVFADVADGEVELTNNIIVAKPGQSALFCGPADGHINPIIRFNNIFSAGGMAYGGSCAEMTGTDKDLEGHLRIKDGDGNGTALVDLGVYEFIAPSAESQSTTRTTIRNKSER